jgi:hypothetical protein
MLSVGAPLIVPTIEQDTEMLLMINHNSDVDEKPPLIMACRTVGIQQS